MAFGTFLGLSADEWHALGQMLLGVAAVVGGGWALYNYHRSRRYEAARWLQGVFRDFYLADTFKDVRELLEYNYPERAGPLLERRITDRDVPITVEEMKLLQDLDTLLNYFEYLLYLEDEGQFNRRDRQAVFEYWFDVMNSPDRASLRRYSANFGFERVAQALSADGSDYVAVYGSLRAGFGLPDRPAIDEDLVVDRGACLISGRLYDLGDYPGLVPGDGVVHGELFELRDLAVLKAFDKYERYDARNPEKSLYLRRAVRLVHPPCDAWVYVYNQSLHSAYHIASGDWAAHQTERRTNDA